MSNTMLKGVRETPMSAGRKFFGRFTWSDTSEARWWWQHLAICLSARELQLGMDLFNKTITHKWFKDHQVNVLEWLRQRPDRDPNKEFVAGPKNSCIHPIPEHPDRAWAVTVSLKMNGNRIKSHCTVKMCKLWLSYPHRPLVQTWRGRISMQSFILHYKS